ncbi:hypothetical protein CBS101457_000086 [Exobasidium rhododendri]|nr:hypothetical protein CBS101457_000086 [Exobasidium rhododendri]
MQGPPNIRTGSRRSKQPGDSGARTSRLPTRSTENDVAGSRSARASLESLRAARATARISNRAHQQSDTDSISQGGGDAYDPMSESASQIHAPPIDPGGTTYSAPYYPDGVGGSTYTSQAGHHSGGNFGGYFSGEGSGFPCPLSDHTDTQAYGGYSTHGAQDPYMSHGDPYNVNYGAVSSSAAYYPQYTSAPEGESQFGVPDIPSLDDEGHQDYPDPYHHHLTGTQGSYDAFYPALHGMDVGSSSQFTVPEDYGGPLPSMGDEGDDEPIQQDANEGQSTEVNPYDMNKPLRCVISSNQEDPGWQYTLPFNSVFSLKPKYRDAPNGSWRSLDDDQKAAVVDRIAQIKPFTTATIRKYLEFHLTAHTAMMLLCNDLDVVESGVAEVYRNYQQKLAYENPKWMDGLHNAQRREVIEKLADATVQPVEDLREHFLKVDAPQAAAWAILNASGRDELLAIAQMYGLFIPQSSAALVWQRGAGKMQMKALLHRMMTRAKITSKKTYNILARKYIPSGFALTMLKLNDALFDDTMHSLLYEHKLPQYWQVDSSE